jgi:hypothetical protein
MKKEFTQTERQNWQDNKNACGANARTRLDLCDIREKPSLYSRDIRLKYWSISLLHVLC